MTMNEESPMMHDDVKYAGDGDANPNSGWFMRVAVIVGILWVL